MTRLYPQRLANRVRFDPKLRAEVRTFDALHNSNSRWVGFHNVAWLGKRSYSGDAIDDGQTDFVLVHPQHGIVLIEVKGGRIAYDGARQTWTTTDREGGVHDIDPIGQLRDAKGYLIDKIKSLPAFTRAWIPVGYGVCFPDCEVPRTGLPSSTPPQIVIDGRDLDRIETRLDEIADYWQGNGQPLDLQTGRRLIECLTEFIAPTLELKNPLRLHLGETDQQIVRLTEEQYHVLDLLSDATRLAVRGCAGSGKTMLALEKVRRLSALGYRVFLTCWHQPLACFLQEVTRGLSNVTCGTLPEITRAFCKQANLPVAEDPESLLMALESLPDERFDAVVVDEGQDFTDLHWVGLLSALKDPDAGTLVIFYDDNQRVHPNVARHLPVGMMTVPLKRNVRNTQAIHAYLRRFYGAESQALGPTGASVETYPADTFADVQKTLGRILHRLIQVERLANADIIILTPRPLTESRLNNLELSGGWRLTSTPSPTTTLEVRLASIADFKGLESSVVILAELEEDLAQHSQADALLYVGLSRARLQMMLIGAPAILQMLVPTR